MRALLALALLAGCPAPDDTDDTDATDTDDTDTTDTDVQTECGERLEVEVVVYNDRLWYVEDAEVAWSAGGEQGTCQPVQYEYDRWRCDTPADGPATITVTHPLYTTVESTVAVDAETGCRSGEEEVQVTLVPNATAFDETRMYYIQRYADQDECDNSWEIHGTGCYYTAVFCADGYSTVMITDIANFGVYDVDGSSVANTAVGVIDIPAQTTWTVTSDTTIEDWDGTEWTLDTDGKFDLIDCPNG